MNGPEQTQSAENNDSSWWKNKAAVVAMLGALGAGGVGGAVLANSNSNPETVPVENSTEDMAVTPEIVTSDNFEALGTEYYDKIPLSKVDELKDPQLTSIGVFLINSFEGTELQELDMKATPLQIAENLSAAFLYTQTHDDPRGLWAMFENPSSHPGYHEALSQLENDGLESSAFIRIVAESKIHDINTKDNVIILNLSNDPNQNSLVEFKFSGTTFKVSNPNN